ncbi:MAG: hypothetical protein M3Z04_11015 [Chloroflexota bacterium]|nr:hypothetical protein [Chloroflexota bacterium]
MRAPVEKAVDWVIGKAVAGLKKVGGLFTGKGKGKNPDPSKDAGKGTAPGGTPADPKAAGTPQPTAAQPGTDARTPEQKKADLDAGLLAADRLVKDEKFTDTQIRAKLPLIQAKYKMKSLELVIVKDTEAGETVHVHGEVNPTGDTTDANRPKEHSIYAEKVGDHFVLKAAYQKIIRDKFYKNRTFACAAQQVLTLCLTQARQAKVLKKKFRQDQKNKVLDRALVQGTGGSTGIPARYRCQNTGSTGPTHKAEISLAEVTIEHANESVVEHWNAQGHNITQNERNDWYDMESNLLVWCRSCNCSKQQGDGVGGYDPQVGPKFRGPGEKD